MKVEFPFKAFLKLSVLPLFLQWVLLERVPTFPWHPGGRCRLCLVHLYGCHADRRRNSEIRGATSEVTGPRIRNNFLQASGLHPWTPSVWKVCSQTHKLFSKNQNPLFWRITIWWIIEICNGAVLSIPCVVKSIFDSHCLLSSGSCLVYDNDRLADSLIWFSVGVKVSLIISPFLTDEIVTISFYPIFSFFPLNRSLTVIKCLL